jgi:hypothetical protein
MNRIGTTLEEDFQSLGMLTTQRSAEMSGILGEDKEDDSDSSGNTGDILEENSDVVNEDDDAISFDGEYVTKELFDRIEALPLDTIDEDHLNQILDGLSSKKIPEDDAGILEQAERVVNALKEGVASRQRRFKAGSTARKISFQCPKGQRAVSTGGGRPVCRPSHIVAGGMGKLSKERRKKKKWSRSGHGTMSQMKSTRVERRRTGLRSEDSKMDETMSPLALELMQISESVSGSSITVRDEIIERIINIIDFLNEEFCEDTIADIYTEAVDSIIDTYEAGRLEEDVMDDDEFIEELSPILNVITKSINRLDDSSTLGND